MYSAYCVYIIASSLFTRPHRVGKQQVGDGSLCVK